VSRPSRTRSRPALLVGAAALMIAAGASDLESAAVAAQPSRGGAEIAVGAPTPELFEVGETLEFAVRSSRFGEVGTGRMAVEGPVRLRGHDAVLLSMEVRGRVAFLRFSDVTRSWFDPSAGASLRFEKEERHPLARREEAVDLLLAEGRWVDGGGEGGALAAAAPLDELSFIYHLRGLDLANGEERAIHRHFDEERNPVRVTAVGTEVLRVPAGVFRTTVVEMEVRDPRRYDEGGNVIRIHLSDDVRRLPVRIESSAPAVGTLVMTLKRWWDGNGAGPG
jgi:hypothetical protein